MYSSTEFAANKLIIISNKHKSNEIFGLLTLFGIPPGLLEGDSALQGGGGRKVPAAYNSKTINDNEMKFGGLVKDH